MMRSFLTKGALVTAASAALLLMAGGNAFAENACKGLEQTKCETNASCTWVDGYTMKTGTKVDSYCRSKGGNSADKAADTKPAAKASTTTETAPKSVDAKVKDAAAPKLDTKPPAAPKLDTKVPATPKLETKPLDAAKDALKDKAKSAVTK